MSLVLIGGNERMVNTYVSICENYGCKAKVFAKENGAIRKKLGYPDMFVLFTNTVSHKMMKSTVKEAKRNNIPVLHCNSSSATALEDLLIEHVVMEA